VSAIQATFTRICVRLEFTFDLKVLASGTSSAEYGSSMIIHPAPDGS
jgi:hypothetical protein